MGNIIVDGPLEKLSGRFTINGAPFDGVLFPLPWPGASSHFWFGEVNDIGGFKLTCDRIPDGASELEINYSEKEQPKRFRCVSSYFFPLMEEEFPLPDEVRRVRVIGSASIDGFRSSGYTDFRRLDLLCKELFGRALGEMGRVLDWGCGCGRVTRHLAAQASQLSTTDCIHGADIDGDNASWCGQNLGINVRQIPLVPPTEFPDGGFDLVFGISVFTHLSEENQFKWLAELRRIVRPGGIVLTTVHGVTAYQQVGIPVGMPELAENWAPEKAGFFVSGSNRQLDGFIESNDYYLNVFHSSNYIRSKWSQFFDVVEIIPGALGTHDLVVLRKPA
jgi:SAM-dependent methyltransferase